MGGFERIMNECFGDADWRAMCELYKVSETDHDYDAEADPYHLAFLVLYHKIGKEGRRTLALRRNMISTVMENFDALNDAMKRDLVKYAHLYYTGERLEAPYPERPLEGADLAERVAYDIVGLGDDASKRRLNATRMRWLGGIAKLMGKALSTYTQRYDNTDLPRFAEDLADAFKRISKGVFDVA